MSEEQDRGGMSVSEAGRRGGLATAAKRATEERREAGTAPRRRIQKTRCFVCDDEQPAALRGLPCLHLIAAATRCCGRYVGLYQPTGVLGQVGRGQP